VRERERERERERDKDRDRDRYREKQPTFLELTSSHFAQEGQWKDGQHWAKTQKGVISVRAPN
jgi:predicted nucleotidyltransferase